MDVRESYIRSDLHHIFKNVITQTPKFNDVEFYDVREGVPAGDGEADIVIFGNKNGKEIKFIIETKKKTRKYIKKFDPYSTSVIGQALGYALALDAQFIATTNGDIFVIFDRYKPGSYLQTQIGEPYKVELNENFAKKILNDLVQYLNGKLKLLNLGEIFVERLKYFHQLIAEPTYNSLKNIISSDKKFLNRYREWIQKQGFKDNQETLKNIAEQEAYLLMNRILFYKTLEGYHKELKLPPLRSLSENEFTPERLKKQIVKCFSYIVYFVDYQAVFNFSEILDEIPISDEVAEHLNNLIKDIEQFNLSQFDRDILGDIYQNLIPPDERKRLGQYYTPKEICDLIVKFSISNKDDRFLDPACGSGGFLVSAYNRLLELHEEKVDKLHKKILNQIYGVDINQFATHLSVMNLTLRNITANTDKVNVFTGDFFSIPSFQASLYQEHERESLENKSKEYIAFKEKFDVIVANPPYTRQDEIGNKEYIDKIRSVALSFYEKEKVRKKVISIEKKIKMSSEAGIYAYFFTQSAHFLKENGIMGFIVSNSWLDVKFGKDLQRFFLDNFKILSIIDFDRRVFKDPLVNTVVIFMKKIGGKENAEERDNNIVKFIRVKKPIKIDELVDLIKNSNEPQESEILRIVTIPQKDLKTNHKWSSFLKAPPIYFKLVNNRNLCKLKEVADIKVGYVTLANDFFIINNEDAKSLGIEDEYLYPVITEPKNIKFLDLTYDDTYEKILITNKSKNQLQGTNLLKYINQAEKRELIISKGHEKGKIVYGYQNLPALKEKSQRMEWYKLDLRKPPDIFIPIHPYERWYAVLNTDKIYSTHNFYWIYSKVDPILLMGLLNNILFEFFVEVMGKTVYGEGVIELLKHIFEEIPVVNPDRISSAYKQKITEIIMKMIKYAREQDKDNFISYRIQLDNLIFDILNLNQKDRKEIYESLEAMREGRKSKVKTELMVS